MFWVSGQGMEVVSHAGKGEGRVKERERERNTKEGTHIEGPIFLTTFRRACIGRYGCLRKTLFQSQIHSDQFTPPRNEV